MAVSLSCTLSRALRPRRCQVCSAASLRPFSVFHPTRQATPTDSAIVPANPYLRPFPSGNSQALKADGQHGRYEDPTYATDELSAHAHAELAAHADLRHLVRLAAWEMPLLSKLSTPFVPPNTKTHPLRWRYTTYMGEAHPGAHKVVVEFKPTHLQDLEEWQRVKFIKLAGPRYDVKRKVVKMSCEAFASQAANKRYLGDVIGKMIAEAKDGEADRFEDVPVQGGRARAGRHYIFPDEWLITDARRQELDSKRRVALLEEGRKVEEGLLIGGSRGN